MNYIRTSKATDWPKHETVWEYAMRLLLFFIPEGNPDYRERYHLLHEWIIEFDDDGQPIREIGLDFNGVVILAGPDERNYGYWLDTNMTLSDFENVPFAEKDFLRLWEQWTKVRLQIK